MPNHCDYLMRVCGSKQNVQEFIKVLQADYDYSNNIFTYDRHIGGRVFEACISDELETDGKYCVHLRGYCAWSIKCSMRDGEHTFFRELMEKYGDKCRSTTLEVESGRLHLDIEVFSEEYSMCFMEHFLVRDGKVEVDDCAEWYNIYFGRYNSKKAAEEDYKIIIPDEDWEKYHDDWCLVGGLKVEWTI